MLPLGASSPSIMNAPGDPLPLPVKSFPVKSDRAQSTPVKSARAQSTPVKSARAESNISSSSINNACGGNGGNDDDGGIGGNGGNDDDGGIGGNCVCYDDGGNDGDDEGQGPRQGRVDDDEEDGFEGIDDWTDNSISPLHSPVHSVRHAHSNRSAPPSQTQAGTRYGHPKMSTIFSVGSIATGSGFESGKDFDSHDAQSNAPVSSDKDHVDLISLSGDQSLAAERALATAAVDLLLNTVSGKMRADALVQARPSKVNNALSKATDLDGGGKKQGGGGGESKDYPNSTAKHDKRSVPEPSAISRNNSRSTESKLSGHFSHASQIPVKPDHAAQSNGSLPVKMDHDSIDGSKSKSSSYSKNAPSLTSQSNHSAPLRVLLVDDNVGIQTMVTFHTHSHKQIRLTFLSSLFSNRLFFYVVLCCVVLCNVCSFPRGCGRWGVW